MPDDRFASHWLSLREPVDHRSRAGPLDAEIAARGVAEGWTHVVDLGCGTGSNLRYLAPRLPWVQRYTLVDHDAELLSQVHHPPGVTADIETVEGDLSHQGLTLAGDADLVTASALLDLVTRDWLARLVSRIDGRARGLLMTLSYDGDVRWEGGGPDPDDAWMAEVVNRHQRGPKEMGAALGPDAPGVARALLDDAGWRCTLAPSPWVLGAPDDLALARAWLGGWSEAATVVAPDEADRIEGWVRRRTDDLVQGRARVRIGHLDLLALPESGGAGAT